MSGYDTSLLNNPGHQEEIHMGNFLLYGTSVVGAVVVDRNLAIPSFTTCTLYAVTNAKNQLLGWLPSLNNVLCLGTAGQSEVVVNQSVSASSFDGSCSGLSNVTMLPLNYGGNFFSVYGGDGPDHIHGGAYDLDIIYGGTGNDDLDDGGNSPSFANGMNLVYGEEGNDFVYGSPGNGNFLSGGPGIDQLFDAGGIADSLYGDENGACCVSDYGHSFSVLDCGGGAHDVVDNLAGTTNCEAQNAICASPGMMRCGGP
jgi:hypothetical protein